MKDKKSKNIVAILCIAILVLILIIVVVNNSVKKDNRTQSEVLNESKEIVSTGGTKLESEARHKKLIEKLDSRKKLIIQKEIVRKSGGTTNLTIQRLEAENIKIDILEFLTELKKENILLGDDAYISDTNLLKIGKISEEQYSFEEKIQTEEEILLEHSEETISDQFIPLDVYERQQKIKEKKEN